MYVLYNSQVRSRLCQEQVLVTGREALNKLIAHLFITYFYQLQKYAGQESGANFNVQQEKELLLGPER